jgi:hypothetical protein
MQQSQNNMDVTEEVTNETVETTDSVDTASTEEPKVELSPAEQIYEDLKSERMGKFVVGLGYADAVFFRNLLDKSTYKGPQQAYLLIIAKAELSQVVQGLKGNEKETRYEVELTSACIESLGYFMNNFEGKGSDSATKLFTASMLLRPSMGLINDLDTKLEEAKKNLNTLDK